MSFTTLGYTSEELPPRFFDIHPFMPPLVTYTTRAQRPFASLLLNP